MIKIQSRITNSLNRPLPLMVEAFMMLILMFKWLMILLESDSYFSVYVFCALVGVSSWFCNVLSKGKHRYDNKKMCISIIFSLFFGLMVLLSNYKLLEKNGVVDSILLFVGSYLLAWNILILGFRYKDAHYFRNTREKCTHSKAVFLASFLIIAIDYSLYLFLVSYPGKLTPDSLSQMSQVLSTITSNAHPFYHTILIKIIIDIGLKFFNDINHAVALFSFVQIIFMSGVFAYMMMTIYQMGSERIYIIWCVLTFIFLPFHIVYSVTMWKDIMFAGAVTLTIVSFYRLITQIGGGVDDRSLIYSYIQWEV